MNVQIEYPLAIHTKEKVAKNRHLYCYYNVLDPEAFAMIQNTKHIREQIGYMLDKGMIQLKSMIFI